MHEEEQKPATRPARGGRRLEIEPDEANTSSKENKPRGRPKKKQIQDAERILQTTAGVDVGEAVELKPQQPLKRRKITPEEPRPKRTRSRTALEHPDAIPVPQPRRRGRQPKTQAIEDEEVNQPPPNGRGKPHEAKRVHSLSPTPKERLRANRQPAKKQPAKAPSPIPSGTEARVVEERSLTGQNEKPQPGRSLRKREIAVAVEVAPKTYGKRKRVVAIAEPDGNDTGLEGERKGRFQASSEATSPSKGILVTANKESPNRRERRAIELQSDDQEEQMTNLNTIEPDPTANARPGSPWTRRAVNAAQTDPTTPSRRKRGAHAARQDKEEDTLEIGSYPVKQLVQPTTPSTRDRMAQSSPTRGAVASDLGRRKAKATEAEDDYDNHAAYEQLKVQLAEQTGSSYLSHFGDGDDEQDRTGGVQNDDDNPFLDSNPGEVTASITLPASSHLPALISLLPTLNRPTIVLVDAFDLFALHPRQALLYCLLDTVQACQSSQGNKGLAVVGITSRVDVVQLLEKRVKSRFSGRTVRVANVHQEVGWTSIARECLLAPIDAEEYEEEEVKEWNELWTAGVEKFLADPGTKQTVHETYSIVRDARVLLRLLITPVARLCPSQPFPSSAILQRAADTQRTRTPFATLHGLPYPALCLLIASRHSQVKGHDIFNFEMLYDAFRIQVRASMAAPIQLNGTSIGMVKCDRGVMLSAFESLVSSRIFVPAAATSFTTPKEFVKYRCAVETEDLKKAVEKTGQVNLKKWWAK
ncbi:hypothetical protein H1R20_g15293, partial [Candolleomyces eurysporus]